MSAICLSERGKQHFMRETRLGIPPLGYGLFLPLGIQFPFPWLRALHKRTLLRMELAQHAARLSLIYDTTTLPPPTRITRSFLPASCICCTRLCTAHACREDPAIFALVDTIRLAGTVWASFARSYSNGGRTSYGSRVRHGVMRLD